MFFLKKMLENGNKMCLLKGYFKIIIIFLFLFFGERNQRKNQKDCWKRRRSSNRNNIFATDIPLSFF